MLSGLTGVPQEAEDFTSEDAGWNGQDAACGWQSASDKSHGCHLH